MAYVSCMLMPPDPFADTTLKEGTHRISCIDDRGAVWWLTDDADIGEYVSFLRDGGVVEPYTPPPEAEPTPEEEPPPDE